MSTAVTYEDEIIEQIVEAIEAQDGPEVSIVPLVECANQDYEQFWKLVNKVLDDMVAAGALRLLDMKYHTKYVRADRPCNLTEPTMTVYRCWGAGGELLYVGCTSGPLRNRLADHHARPWWSAVTNVTTERVVGWQRGLDHEAAAIRAERPLHNIRHNEGRRAA